MDEIRRADLVSPVQRDRFGGMYVMRKDAAMYGALAIVHRRMLLEYVDELKLKLEGKRKRGNSDVDSNQTGQ